MYTVGEFPEVTIKLLDEISQIAKQHGNKLTRVKELDLQMRIDTGIFFTERKNCCLNEEQKFELIKILCVHFSKEELKDLTLRHIHFDIIFCGREGDANFHETRVNFLLKVCLMALQYPVYEFFEDVSKWLFKIGSGKLYAKRLIGELVDKFILLPERFKMYEFVYPLKMTSISFAFIFIVFSVSEESLCPTLILILSNWLATNFNEFFFYFKGVSHNFTEIFVTESFPLLLKYDSENFKCDEIHDCLHYVITKFLIKWHTNIQTENGEKVFNNKNQLNLDCNVLKQIDFLKLEYFAKERFIDNLENALRFNHFSLNDKTKFKFIFKNKLENYPMFLDRLSFWLS